MKIFTQELKEGETIIKIVHKHWASFIIPAAKIFLSFSVPFFLSSFLFSSSIGLIIFIVLCLVAGIYSLNLWMKWYFDLFVITNSRILNIDQKSIFSREVSEATYKNVQGVNYELSGIFAMLFNYGTVKIQAIGIKNLIKIESVDNPKSLQELILDIKEKSTASDEMSARDLINYISGIKKDKNIISEPILEKTSIKLENKAIPDEETK